MEGRTGEADKQAASFILGCGFCEKSSGLFVVF